MLNLKKIFTYAALLLLLITIADFAAPERSFAKQGKNIQVSEIQLQSLDILNTNLEKPFRMRWDKDLGIPRSLNSGYTKSLTGSPEKAAQNFLKNLKGLYRIKNVSDLKLDKVNSYDGEHHVRFQQYFQGIPIEGGEIRIHLNKENKVSFINGPFHPDVEVFTVQPSLCENDAVEIAESDVHYQGSLKKESTAELVIFPKDGNYLLSWKVIVYPKKPLGSYQYFINAQTGEIEFDENLMKFGSGKITGNAYLKHPHAGDLAERGLEHLRVELWNNGSQSTTALTEDGGCYTFTGSYDEFACWAAEGEYVRVYNEESDEAKYKGSSPSHYFDFDPSNTHFDETMAFWHTNRIHDYYSDYLGYNNMDFLITVYVHYGPISAGYSNYEIILGDGDPAKGQRDHALEAAVIYHEYTHCVVEDRIGVSGRIEETQAMHESIADFFACSFDNDSEILEYASPNSKRDLNNTMKYPNDMNDDHYNNSKILSGTLWDIRTALGYEKAEKDAFKALFYLPYNPTFNDFYAAMKEADQANYSGANIATIDNKFQNRGIGYLSGGTNFYNWLDEGEAIDMKSDKGITNIKFLDINDKEQVQLAISNCDDQIIWEDHYTTFTTDNDEKWYIYCEDVFSGTSSCSTKVWITTYEDPEITITKPEDSDTFEIGNKIYVEADYNGMGEGGTNCPSNMVSVKFYINNEFREEDKSPPFKFNFTPSKAGDYNIKAIVKDPCENDDSDIIKVTVKANVSFSDDFNDGNDDGWIETGYTHDDWSVTNGVYTELKMNYSSDDPENGDMEWDDYSLKAEIIGNNCLQAGIKARCNNNGLNCYCLKLDYENNHITLLSSSDGGWSGSELGDIHQSLNSNNNYELKLTLNGNSLKSYLDGTQIFDITDNSYTKGRIGLYNIMNWEEIMPQSYFDNVIVGSVQGLGKGVPDIERIPELPKTYSLSANYPNPFNPTTTISYALPKEGNVKISVYNITGKLIKTLVNDYKDAGNYNAKWNGKDESGNSVSSGVYFYHIKAGDFTAAKRMLLVK